MLLFIGVGRSDRGDTLHCAACGALIARADAICRVMGRPPRRTYENPHGLLCPIVTLAEVTSLAHQDHSSTEHTGFAGSAWQPAACAVCDRFLGWRFEATTVGAAPPEFHGLLEERLVSRPGEGRSPAPPGTG